MNNPFNRARITAKYRLMVVSAKGGVGKSTMTVNVAAALSARGLSVGIFDADIHGPNIPALLGMTQTRNVRMTNPDAMIPIEARPESMDTRPIQPVMRYGIKVMSLGLLVGQQQTLNPEPQIMGQMVTFLLSRVDWGDIDILLLDMPPGTGEPLGAIVENDLVDGVLLVSVREQLAHLDNGRLLSFLKMSRVRVLGVVENMTHIICPRCGELIELYPSPAAEESIYGSIPVLGAIPFDPSLIRHVRGGPPLPLAMPESPVAISLLTLADQIIELKNRK